MALRVCVPGDAEALSRLGRATFVDTFGHLYSAQNLDAFLESDHSLTAYRDILADARYRVWLLEEGGEAVGYAVAGPCGLPVPAPETSDGEVKRLYVAPGRQGGGRGARLMDAAMAWLSEAGYGPVYLSVYAENFGAQRFYARYGFVKVKEYEFLVGEHRDPEFIYRKVR